MVDSFYVFLVLAEKILINVLLITITAWIIYSAWIKKDKDTDK